MWPYLFVIGLLAALLVLPVAVWLLRGGKTLR